VGINSPGVPGSQLPAGEDFAQRQIKDLQRELRELGPSIAKSFAPVIARLDAADAAFAVQQALLTATVADLATAQATLATTVSGLTTAQANIAANVASIAANVADINTLVGDQVTGTAGNATTGATAVGLSTSAASFATITINVPAGFTVAAVAANTSMAMMGTITGYVRTRIGGSDGPNMLVFTDGTAGNGSSNFSRVFTVTSGGTFTVEARAYGATGSETAYIANAASVTFFR